MNLKKRMIDFIKKNGKERSLPKSGRGSRSEFLVRFDDYTKEHLFNPEVGYFNRFVEIGKEGDEKTRQKGGFSTNAEHEAFAELIDWLVADQLDCTKGHFVEIGGGPGTFKRNLMAINPEMKYISIDGSRKFLNMQRVDGTKTIYSDVTERIDVADGAVEGVIFANELITNFPCRVFGIEDCRLTEELFVVSDGRNVEARMEPLEEKDKLLELYEKCLEAYGINGEAAASVSPAAIVFLQECYRILKKGYLILIDYGYYKGTGCAWLGTPRRPFYTERGQYCGVSEILKDPYTVDITYKLNFDFLRMLGKIVGFSSCKQEAFTNVCSRFLLKGDVPIKGGLPPERYDPLMGHNDFTVLIFFK